MHLFWQIRYFDSREKVFKDRDLWLDTNALDPVTKAAVEAARELKDWGNGRKMLRFRHLFREEKYVETELEATNGRHSEGAFFCVPGYFEDENGKELTPKEMGVAVTGDPNAVLLPASAKQHDIDFMFAPKPSIDLSKVQVASTDLNTLGYFSRDLRELEASAFLDEGPGTITFEPGRRPIVQTSVSEDEIRSFVTIFRRLYMAKEHGNFLNGARAFASAISPHPVGKWVAGVAVEYQHTLEGIPDMIPSAPKSGVTFTRKTLIDVFIYTQFAHQGEEKRERQYAECLAQVKGQEALLFWLFLKSIWECALHILNAGIQIAQFTEAYCKCYDLAPCAVGPASGYADMGTLEKRQDFEARVLRERSEELAMELWRQNGRPEGGQILFVQQARKQLMEAMGMIPDKNEATE